MKKLPLVLAVCAAISMTFASAALAQEGQPYVPPGAVGQEEAGGVPQPVVVTSDEINGGGSASASASATASARASASAAATASGSPLPYTGGPSLGAPVALVLVGSVFGALYLLRRSAFS